MLRLDQVTKTSYFTRIYLCIVIVNEYGMLHKNLTIVWGEKAIYFNRHIVFVFNTLASFQENASSEVFNP